MTKSGFLIGVIAGLMSVIILSVRADETRGYFSWQQGSRDIHFNPASAPSIDAFEQYSRTAWDALTSDRPWAQMVTFNPKPELFTATDRWGMARYQLQVCRMDLKYQEDFFQRLAEFEGLVIAFAESGR